MINKRIAILMWIMVKATKTPVPKFLVVRRKINHLAHVCTLELSKLK